MDHWQLQQAKNRFSEVVKKALQDGPQIVTKRGVETAVVMSVEEYRKLLAPNRIWLNFFKNRLYADQTLIWIETKISAGRSICELPTGHMRHFRARKTKTEPTCRHMDQILSGGRSLSKRNYYWRNPKRYFKGLKRYSSPLSFTS